jgi:hypothetical protein
MAPRFSVMPGNANGAKISAAISQDAFQRVLGPETNYLQWSCGGELRK